MVSLSTSVPRIVRSCHDLAFAMQSATSEPSGSGPRLDGTVDRFPVARIRQGLAWLAAGLGLGGAAAVVMMWTLYGRGSTWRSPDPSAGAAARRAAIQVTGLGDIRSSSVSMVALSADGLALVYGTPAGSTSGSLHIRRLDGLESRPIEGTAGAQGAFLSQYGTVVGFQRDGEIFTVPITGGAVTRVKGSTYLAEGRPAWTADGRIEYTGQRGELLLVRPDGSPPERLTQPAPGEQHLSPHPLPDGRTVLFTSAGADINDTRIAAVSLADRQVRTVLAGGAMTPQYAAGYLLYVRPDRALMAVAFDAARGNLSGQPIPLPDRVSRTRFGVAHFAAVPGVLGYVPSPLTRLVEIHRDGRRDTLVNEERSWHHPRYSPDGARIVMDLTAGGTDRDVWIYDRRLKTLSRITRIGDAHDPSWLPGGAEVSFFSFKSAGGPLMTAAADGASEPRAVRIGSGFSPADLVNPGVWLRDGSAYIGGVRSQGMPGDIWRIPRDGSPPVKLVGSSYDEVAISVSPDGRWMAHQSDETGRTEIYVRPIDRRDGRLQVSSSGGSEPVWDPGGTILYHIEADGVRRRLVAATLRNQPLAVAGRAIVVPDLRLDESDNHPNYDVHPSEPRFVLPELEVGGGLVGVFDWAASLGASLAPRRTTGR